MKKLILKSMMLLSVLALTFTSCSDNDDKVVTTPVSLSIEMPLGLENIVLSNAKAVFTNVTTNETFIQEQFQEKNGSFMASVADVELFAVHIADVGLLRRAGGRRVGGVKLAVRYKVLGAHGEVLAVAANGDGALQVGAVDVHLCVPQNA